MRFSVILILSVSHINFLKGFDMSKKVTETARTIAEAMITAETPSQKGACTRRLKAFCAKRAQLGMNPAKVEAGVRSLKTRLERTHK